MAGGIRNLRWVLTGEDRSASKALDGVGKTAEKVHKKFGAIGASLAGLAVGGAIGASISAASDLNESLSKTAAVFGTATAGVTKFADTAATKLGQSKQQALEATSTFGNLFVALGFGQKPAADLSTKLVGLAGDLASFNNVSSDDALLALRSGLLGEAEPLRKFGVSLSEARIQSEALSLGLVKSTGNVAKIALAHDAVAKAQENLTKISQKHGHTALDVKIATDKLANANYLLGKQVQGTVPKLTAAQKAQAAYSIIMKDTKTAQGDFARTSDGLANSQRILQAQFADARAELGTKLLPVMLKMTHALSGLIAFVERNSAVLKPLGVAVGVLAAGLFTLVKVTRIFTATMEALDVVMAANPIGLVVIAVAALAVGLVIAYRRSETFRKIVNGAFKAIGDAAKAMWGIIRPVLKAWADVWLTVVGLLVDGAAKAFGWVPGIGPKLKAAAKEFDKFKAAVNNSLDGITPTKTITITALTSSQAAAGTAAIQAEQANQGVAQRQHRGVTVVVHHTTNVDGKTVAKSTTTHQTKAVQRGALLPGLS